MKTNTTYACEICGASYSDAADAEACEARGRERTIVSVGDIVYASAGFSWFDGDALWISNPEVAVDGTPKQGTVSTKPRNPKHGNCFDACCTYRFYYVVAAIDYKVNHRARYHLFTKAMSEGQGYRSGWTYNDGHITPERIADPPSEVIAASVDLIGRIAERLL